MQNTIYSKITNKYIPVRVEKKVFGAEDDCPWLTEYKVYDNYKKVGFVRLQDTDKGCYVQYIKNELPNEYRNFGYLADKLEVQHCMDRGMKDFEITSYAAMNSHAMHYKRGKRFIGNVNQNQMKRFQELFGDTKIKKFNINTIVKYIVDKTPKGEKFNTWFLKQAEMYMPKNLIKKYICELKENPIKIIQAVNY